MTKEKKKNNEKIENNEIVEEIIEEVEEIEEFNDKEVTIMDMLNRIVVCLIIIAVILATNVIVLIFKDNTSSDSTNGETKTSETTSNANEQNSNCIDGYDTSKMENVDLEGILNLFDSKDTYVLYIGRCDCSACAAYLPTLNQVADEYDFKTQYYDINTLNASDENYEKVINKLTKKYKMNYQGEDKTETFGYWMGFTPMTIIIKDGKQVDGEIGAIDYETLTNMLEKNGISKE